MTWRGTSLVVAAGCAISLLVMLLWYTERATSQVETAHVLISEIAWAGTIHSPSDEWIELYNAGATPVDLSGWTLTDSSGDVNVNLTGVISPGAFFLLERTADDTVSDVAADQVYVGALNNSGETIMLSDVDSAIVDTANAATGGWPAGQGTPDYVSMERVSPDAADNADGWVSNDLLTINGVDAGDHPIHGTPRAANASWTPIADDVADLAVSLLAPETTVAGAAFQYHLHLSNEGPAAAHDVTLTHTLPAGVVYYADDSDLEPDLEDMSRPVWQAGSLESGSSIAFIVTATVAPTVTGTLLSELRTSSSSLEDQYDNNLAQSSTAVLLGGEGSVLIGALLYDGYELGDADEAVQLLNTGTTTVAIGGWTLGDGSTEAAFDSDLKLEPLGSNWLARDADAFARQFGFAPDAVLIPWPGFANAGDEVLLRRPDGEFVDSLIYKDGDPDVGGWNGATVWPYQVSGLFAEEGQLLYRRRDEASGLPVPDSDRADDWAQMMSDPVQGRKVQYPGWSNERFFQPVLITGTETVTIGVAPDNAFETIIQEIERAQHTIRIETLTLENVAIGNALATAAMRGVAVTVLLEGTPVGGIDDQQRHICQQLEANGAACWFMIRDDSLRIHDRYRYLHAKFMVVDSERALISSENLSPFSLPDDDKADGTWGRRGLVLVTSAGGVVQRLDDLFDDDLAPETHQDLIRWHTAHAEYGPPPEGYIPVTITGGTTYTVRYPQSVTFHDATSVSAFHAPENVLRMRDGLLALLQTAGTGDKVLVQQLAERFHWGATDSDPQSDPNPRLEAYINAARRGATVRLMLDSHFDTADDPLSNTATCAYVNHVATVEHLRLRCVLANPTGLGIHNKMVLLKIGEKGWIHVGSWNGTEQSAKGNREVVIQVQSNGAYAYLAALFESDWPHKIWLPITVSGFRGPENYPLISELLYDPSGPDDGEFIEINNPTADGIDLSGWIISDAVAPEDFEDARSFPSGTLLMPQSALVVALSATSFEATFGFVPDFEILNSRPDVPDMLDDTRWGDPAAILQMGNGGDEVLLRSPVGIVVDAVTFGMGAYPGVVSCPLVEVAGSSIERIPYWQDSDDCGADFRSWPFPSPGILP